MDLLSPSQVCDELGGAQGILDGCLAYAPKMRDGKLADRRIYRGFLKIDILNVSLAVGRTKPFFEANARPPTLQAFLRLEEYMGLLAKHAGPPGEVLVHPTAVTRVLNRVKDLMATLAVAARSSQFG